MNGPVEVLLFYTRDGMIKARVTMSDPMAPATPYVVPPQIMKETRPCHGLHSVLEEAGRLIARMKETD